MICLQTDHRPDYARLRRLRTQHALRNRQRILIRLEKEPLARPCVSQAEPLSVLPPSDQGFPRPRLWPLPKPARRQAGVLLRAAGETARGYLLR